MAICDLLTGGIGKTCDNNTGGVSKIYIADFGAVTSITATGGTVSAIGLTSSAKYYEFSFNRNTSSYEEAITISLENGSTFFAQTVNLVIPRREISKRQRIGELVSGQKELSVIVKDSNGIYWLFGKEEGLIVSELTGGSGVAKGDANGYTVTITGEEPAQAYVVASGIIPSLIA